MVKITEVQKQLEIYNIDGWLIYDFHNINPLAHDFLEIPDEQILTRRFFYWIPKEGEPVKIVHAIESYALDHLSGEKKVYLHWQTLDTILKEVLHGKKHVAMEYSPDCAVPYLSKVDGGTIDLVRKHGTKVVSSGPFLQAFTCVWDAGQLESHLFAAKVLEGAVDKAWKFIADRLKKNEAVTEYDVQLLILSEFERTGCETNHPPTCSVNAHSAMPHYTPGKNGSSRIKKGDFVLIDLWCKQKKARAVYADITRVAVADNHAKPEELEVFKIVRAAQKAATDFVEKRYAKGEEIKGYEVDQVARKVIDDAGYGDFFTHRLGHNINIDLHGPGTHLDSLETNDDRPLIAGTCFSVEPGIYLPGKFGIRLEYDIYLAPDRKILIAGGIQNELKLLL